MYLSLTRVVLLVAGLGAAAPPALTELLTIYAAGRYDEAIAAAAAIGDLGPLRLRFIQDVPAWVSADPERAGERRAAAAAFLVELAHARLETDWARLHDLIEWMCLQLRAAPPGEFERAWHRASVALAGRGRQRIWLLGDYPLLPQQRPPARLQKVENPSPQHLIHALDRFPDDAQLTLARVVAWTWGRDAEPTRNIDVAAGPPSARRRASVAEAIAALEALQHDRDVGPEARVRIGQLHMALADPAAALPSFEAAASSDRLNVRYLAYFLSGRALEGLNRPNEARKAYETALAMWPTAESAVVALASLQFVQDDRAAAVALLERRFEQPVSEDDPGRLAGYGSFMHWRSLRDDLRARLRP